TVAAVLLALALRSARITTARLAAAAERLTRGDLVPAVTGNDAAIGELGRLEAALGALRDRMRSSAVHLEDTTVSATASTDELTDLVEGVVRVTTRITTSVGETT